MLEENQQIRILHPADSTLQVVQQRNARYKYNTVRYLKVRRRYGVPCQRSLRSARLVFLSRKGPLDLCYLSF